MLILTDDGPINCDDARHLVRDMRTGRPRRSPEQLARDEARLLVMVREWVASKSKRHAQDSRRSTLRQDTKPMRSRFNASALLQRDPDSSDGGAAFADYIASRKLSPLEFWRKRLRDVSRTVSGHAFDSADGREEALKHLQQMENHINVRGGSSEFDPAYLARCFTAMLEAMGSEEDGAEDDDPAGPGRSANSGEDDLGETPARAVVRTGSRKIDHRKDFNCVKQGGADSALTDFDADRLFQRSDR